MTVRFALFGAVLALGLSGCATSYGTQGLTGGYSDRQIDGDVWQVSFYGNGFTTRETVQTFWLYRCAELTLEKGYDGFELASDVHLVSNVPSEPETAQAIPVHGGGGGGGSHYVYIPVYVPNIAKPFIVASIKMVKQPFTANPPQRFDAHVLEQTLAPLVKGKLCDQNVCPHPHTYLGDLKNRPNAVQSNPGDGTEQMDAPQTKSK